MENQNPENEGRNSSPQRKEDVDTDGGSYVRGDVNTGGGGFIGRDYTINIKTLKIPLYLVIFIAICILGIFGVVAYPSVAQWLPKPLAFPIASADETLILLATFHNTSATNAEAHIKIQRAIEAEAVKHGEQGLRVEVEPTILTADQRAEAEVLGKRYNASMVIWGEDTGVEVIVNLLNLKGYMFGATPVTITERERTQLAKPDAYTHFITNDLPQQMTFFALFIIGQSCYCEEKDYKTAIERTEAAIALLPTTTTLDGLADAYFYLGWLYQTSPQINLPKAIVNYNKAIELDPTNAYTYGNRGISRHKQGDLEGALADYNKAIELDPNYANAYGDRGVTYYLQGDLEAALADYNKAIELDPNYADAYVNRGISRHNQGDLEAALADYNKAIGLYPTNAEAYANRGVTYSAQGDLEAALADYNKAIELDPNYALGYLYRGIARSDQGDLEAAIADFDKAIAVDPNNALTYNNLCWIYSLHEKPELALPNCDRAIELDTWPGDYDSRGLAHALLGDFPAAIADFQTFVDFIETSNDPALSKYLETRKQWIIDLRAGKNPFTEEVLEKLKHE